MNKKTRPTISLRLLAALFLTVSAICAGCAASPSPANPVVNTKPVTLEDLTEKLATPAPTPESTPAPTPEPFREYDITLMAVGDNLLHMGIVNTGKQADGSYNYSFLFQNIADFLAAADIKAINQETILGGNDLGFSGYPRFNSPTEVGDAIVEAGFNVVLHATNHTADQGMQGIQNCVAYWKGHPEVVTAGMSDDGTASDIKYLAVGDITFAILNYTYGPNAATLSPDLRGNLNMLCDYNRETGAIDFTSLNPQVTEDIQKATENADIVIVFPHWGNEYQTVPSDYQRRFAEAMTAAGANLIIGTHPHVPQPVEWITTEDGRQSLCYFSLGNYVSTQLKTACMLGGMAWVTFHVTEDGIAIAQQDTGVLPLVNHYNYNPFRYESVYLLEDYTEEMAQRHGIRTRPDGEPAFRLADMQTLSQSVFGDMVMTRAQILKQDAESSAP